MALDHVRNVLHGFMRSGPIYAAITALRPVASPLYLCLKRRHTGSSDRSANSKVLLQCTRCLASRANAISKAMTMRQRPQCGPAEALQHTWTDLGTSAQELSLDFTLPTGQSFRWKTHSPGEYFGVVGERAVGQQDFRLLYSYRYELSSPGQHCTIASSSHSLAVCKARQRELGQVFSC